MRTFSAKEPGGGCRVWLAGGAPVKRSQLLVTAGFLFVVAVVAYMAFDARWRSATPPVANNQLERSEDRASPPGISTNEIRKEATCRTVPSAGQASMGHETCAYIASQIPVLASKTEDKVHSDANVPSVTLTPGSNIPPDVQELKPLPATVTERLPDLAGHKYFLAGQDIVVVGKDEQKVAFVINVRVRP